MLISIGSVASWFSLPIFFCGEENVATAVAGIALILREGIRIPMKLTEAQLRKIIREEVIREARQEMLREGLLDAIKSAIGSGEGGGSGAKPSAAFATIGKMFSDLSARISSDVNKIQSALPTSEEPTDAVGIANAIVNGFISGGLGSLSQMNKDLGMLGKAFEGASKTVEADPDGTKKNLMRTVNASLGKATSGG